MISCCFDNMIARENQTKIMLMPAKGKTIMPKFTSDLPNPINQTKTVVIHNTCDNVLKKVKFAHSVNRSTHAIKMHVK